MKVIKIDVVNKTITELEIEPGIQAIYKAIECDTFDCVPLRSPFPKGHVIYVDDNGLLNEPIGAFKIKGYSQPLSGHGLIGGIDSAGESIDCTVTIEQVQEWVQFVDITELPEPGFEFYPL